MSVLAYQTLFLNRQGARGGVKCTSMLARAQTCPSLVCCVCLVLQHRQKIHVATRSTHNAPPQAMAAIIPGVSVLDPSPESWQPSSPCEDVQFAAMAPSPRMDPLGTSVPLPSAGAPSTALSANAPAKGDAAGALMGEPCTPWRASAARKYSHLSDPVGTQLTEMCCSTAHRGHPKRHRQQTNKPVCPQILISKTILTNLGGTAVHREVPMHAILPCSLKLAPTRARWVVPARAGVVDCWWRTRLVAAEAV